LKKVLFTYLDGTLLDLSSYSSKVVQSAVSRLKDADISIVFCSSKTFAEQQRYLSQLNLREPAIVENGSAIFLSQHEHLQHFFSDQLKWVNGTPTVVLGTDNRAISKALLSYAHDRYPGLQCYANQSVAQVSAITGLDTKSALLAFQRDFSETIFNIKAGTKSFVELAKALKTHGLQCTPGSKYVTVTGAESSKGRAVKMLVEAYSRHNGEVSTFGIGDSVNDVTMLEAVDFPYLVQKPGGAWADIHLNNLTKTGAPGPHGWKIMAEEILAV
jgi:mannosyl-3-phosphoglycerate phosphatase family protein